VRSFSLAVLCALPSCAYPEFAFVGETGAVEDTFVAVDTRVEPADAAETIAPTVAYPSCTALHAAVPAQGSGVATLDPDGDGPIAPFSTYCDMDEDGGGWTLALKIDGAKSTFVYASPLWTNDETLNSTSTAYDTSEAKFASFSTMPFTSLRLGMLEGGTRRFIRLAVTSTSLRALFSGGPVTTMAGRAEWMKLLADARLQPNCSAEGFNRDFSSVTVYAARIRLGLLGNNESDCGSPDSFIGFGGGFVEPHACVGAEPGIVVGNYNPISCGNSPGVERATVAFGYVFLR